MEKFNTATLSYTCAKDAIERSLKMSLMNLVFQLLDRSIRRNDRFSSLLMDRETRWEIQSLILNSEKKLWNE